MPLNIDKNTKKQYKKRSIEDLMSPLMTDEILNTEENLTKKVKEKFNMNS